jgi:carbamoyl-phosphate synthase large subunit
VPEASVLLTCSGQRVDIVRAFQDVYTSGAVSGQVVVSDSDELSPSLHAADGVVTLPNVDDPGYGAAVASVCAEHGVRAVLPLTDLDPVILSAAAPLVEAVGAHVFLPNPEVALGCQDKWACHEMLQAAGLPSPPTWLPGTIDPAELPYPVLLKPRIGFAARNIHECRDPEELAFFLRYTQTPDSVIQRKLHEGVEFSIDCLADLDCEPIGAIPRRMLQAKGGEQIKGETIDDPRLGLRGPSTVQCFRAGDEILGITDINTRFGGGFPLPLAAGGDYPELILRMASGEHIDPRLGQHRAGVVMTRYLDQFILERHGEILATPARAAAAS